MKEKIDTGQITFFSNGENLIDYTIYGAAGGIGDRTNNLFNKNSAKVDGYINNSGILTPALSSYETGITTYDYIPVDPNCSYSYKSYESEDGISNKTIRINYYTSGKTFISRYFKIDQGTNAMTVITPVNCYYVRFSIDNSLLDIAMTQGGEMSSDYEPYGYKIPIICRGVTTNIYLDEPLYKGDSISFSIAQVNIPTIDGENTLIVNTQNKPSGIMVKTNEGVFQIPPERKPFSDYHYNMKMDIRNELLRSWATKDNGAIVPKSWNHVQFLVKQGLHKDVFHIGDELVCKRGNDDIVWQVIGMDIDEPADPQYKHSMTLCMRDLLSNDTVAFSARQALFYFSDGLSAGTYYFTITQHSWVASDVNKSFYFTLTSNIPKKGQIVLQNAYSVSCENKTLKTYASSTSTTEIETATMYLWDNSIEATFLGNVNNSLQTNINCLPRAFLGNNNYKESHIRQWINGGEKSTLVYQPQTVFDRPPTWNNTNVGLLKGMDNDFLKVIKPTKIKTARNTLIDGGGSDITEDKFFLLSKPQVYGGVTVSNIDEGNVYPYFENYSSLSTASTSADKNRIKIKNGTAVWWWLRSPLASDGRYIWSVSTVGGVGSSSATTASGIAAACNIFG